MPFLLRIHFFSFDCCFFPCRGQTAPLLLIIDLFPFQIKGRFYFFLSLLWFPLMATLSSLFHHFLPLFSHLLPSGASETSCSQHAIVDMSPKPHGRHRSRAGVWTPVTAGGGRALWVWTLGELNMVPLRAGSRMAQTATVLSCCPPSPMMVVTSDRRNGFPSSCQEEEKSGKGPKTKLFCSRCCFSKPL